VRKRDSARPLSVSLSTWAKAGVPSSKPLVAKEVWAQWFKKSRRFNKSINVIPSAG
jgi:hypothetical protein